MNCLLLIILLLFFIVIIYICIFCNINIFFNKKFFKEDINNPHLDYRYSKSNITLSEIHETLIFLLDNFSKYCEKNYIKPIIMHGSLIGYYFNQKILPWDDDIDIILDENSVKNLVNSEHNINDDILIEINKNYKNRSKLDFNNRIDARIISKINGVFIDITFFYSNNHDEIQAKDGHIYSKSDIYPLKKTKFENSVVYVPFNIKNCLIREYGKKVLNNSYENYIFDTVTKKWNERI